jgi:hypothetical protein
VKPYKINKTWVDLDHVLSMDDEVTVDFRSYGIGNIQCAFRSEPITIWVGDTQRWMSGDGQFPRGGFVRDDKLIAEARERWEAFKTAWKTKDTMFGESK